MTGASGQQLQLQQEQMDFYQQGMQEATQVYGEDQNLLQLMQSVYSPILQAGPSQLGYSTGQLENENAQAIEGTAANYENAARAGAASVAAEGGALPGGAEAEAQETAALTSARTESNEESNILQADYEQGFKNFQTAGEGLATVAGDLSPTAYENSATSAGSAASETAAAIAKEKESWMAPVLGALGSIAGAGINKLGGGSGGGGGGGGGGSGYNNYTTPGYNSGSSGGYHNYSTPGYGGGGGGTGATYGGGTNAPSSYTS